MTVYVRADSSDFGSQESGIIVFHVKSGELSKKGRLEVLLDDGYWPAFSTTRATGHHAMWQHVGEGFLKELDFGQVWLRLNEADHGGKDDIFGEWKGEAKQFLSQTLVRHPFVFPEPSETLNTTCRALRPSSN